MESLFKHVEMSTTHIMTNDRYIYFLTMNLNEINFIRKFRLKKERRFAYKSGGPPDRLIQIGKSRRVSNRDGI